MFGNNYRKEERKIQSEDFSSNVLGYGNPFLAIVTGVVTKNSDNLKSYVSDEELSKYLDNRHEVYAIPVGKKTTTAIICKLLNKRDYELPMENEAVLVMPTPVGFVLLDVFTLSNNLNYDPSAALLSNNVPIGVEIKPIEISNETKNSIVRESIKDVPPFFSKIGHKYMLGRNGQYIIFDSKKRYNDEEETDGSFIKVGFRIVGEQEDTKDDSCILFTKNEKIQKMLSERLQNKYNISEDNEPINGIGVQSEEVYLYGSRFVVLYSKENLLIHAVNNIFLTSKKILLEALENVTIEASKISIGNNANSPIVLGDKMIDMMSDFISIVENIPSRILLPVGGKSISATPDVILQINNFKLKYLSKQSSVLSKKSFVK